MPSKNLTTFGSLKSYTKGTIEIFNDDVKNYVFSNIFEIARNAKIYDRIAVAKNFKYIIESVYAMGHSAWYICNHDEFILVMDGKVQVELMKPDHLNSLTLPQEGATKLPAHISGKKMGTIKTNFGHMVLLPQKCAYRFVTDDPALFIIQTIEGPLTSCKWQEICSI